MNIHIDDKNQFNTLLNSTLVKVEMGSVLYGLKNKFSDTDYLCIYAPSKNESESFTFTHHQFQFKDTENNIDYIFVNLYNFIRNTLNGDSTINFEVINSRSIIDSPLSFLYEMRSSFINYYIMRSYLGMAKRDLKHVEKQSDDRAKNKRLIHAFRGYWFASNMLKGTFNLMLDKNQMSVVEKIRSINNSLDRLKEITSLKEEIELLRKKLNNKLDDNLLTRMMDVESQKELDKKLSILVNSDYYKSKVNNFIDISSIYYANENGITY